jgi:23S rRNA pseudoU1915 N3-methylase RlmH
MKAFNIAFTFDQKVPGVITIPAETSDEAAAKLKDYLKDFSNVDIKEVVDIDNIPAIRKMVDEQLKQEEEAKAWEEAEKNKTVVETEVVN